MAEEGKEGNKPNENTGTRQWGDEEHIATANYMFRGLSVGICHIIFPGAKGFCRCLPLFVVFGLN